MHGRELLKAAFIPVFSAIIFKTSAAPAVADALKLTRWNDACQNDSRVLAQVEQEINRFAERHKLSVQQSTGRVLWSAVDFDGDGRCDLQIAYDHYPEGEPAYRKEVPVRYFFGHGERFVLVKEEKLIPWESIPGSFSVFRADGESVPYLLYRDGNPARYAGVMRWNPTRRDFTAYPVYERKPEKNGVIVRTVLRAHSNHYIALARDQLRRGDTKRADQYAQMALEADAGNDLAAETEILTAYLNGNFARARTASINRLQARPDQVSLYYLRGIAEEGLGQPEWAVDSYTDYLRQAPHGTLAGEVKQRIDDLRQGRRHSPITAIELLKHFKIGVP